MLKFITVGVLLLISSTSSSPVTRLHEIELPGNEKIAKRAVTQQKSDEKIPTVHQLPQEERIKRSTDEDLNVAESTMVFLPFFRTKSGPSSKIKRSVNDKMDDMEAADSNIVFIPLFRKDQYNRRFRRSEDEFWFAPTIDVGILKSEEQSKNSEKTDSTTTTTTKSEERKSHIPIKRSSGHQDEIMENAEDMVFLPIFKKEYSARKSNFLK